MPAPQLSRPCIHVPWVRKCEDAITLIRRPWYLADIESALASNPISALMGLRQCGKTTLARQAAKRHKLTVVHCYGNSGTERN
jgi:AAA+ ATPase superfamily predicted ATPase